MGENVWRDEQEWPLARTAVDALLPAQRRTRPTAASATARSRPRRPMREPTDGYRYDPARPVPFMTEPTSSQIGGPDDYAAVERRDDVLVYLTEPLAQDVEVTGADHGRSLRRVVGARHRFHGQAARRLAERLRAAALRWHRARALPRGDGRRRRSSSRAKSTSTRIDCWHTAQVFQRGASHRPGDRVERLPEIRAQPEYRRATGHDQ